MVTLTKLTIIKLLEFILCIVLLALHYESSGFGRFEDMMSITSFAGYVIILLGVIAGMTTGTPVNRRIDLYFSLVGFILFLFTGIMIFVNANYRSALRGVITIINALLFLVDAAFTFRGEA